MIPFNLSKNLKHLWLIDVDGTILKHNGYLKNGDELLPGVKEMWDSIPEKDVIFIISARQSKYKDMTLEFLDNHGLRYNHAIFGVPHGERIVINDNKPSDNLQTAVAWNVERNAGFVDVSADNIQVEIEHLTEKEKKKEAKAQARLAKMEELARQIESNQAEFDIDDLKYAHEYKELFKDIVKYMTDPAGQYGNGVSLEKIVGRINNTSDAQLIGLSEDGDVTENAKRKGLTMDPIVENFIIGAAGRITTWDGDAEHLKNPIALRSIAKRKQMHACLESGRDFYYIDTGYFGNGKSKKYHRVTKNAMQWLGPIEDRPADRFEATGEKIKKYTTGSKILLCPPSQKALKYWDLDLSDWLEQTIDTIRENTDREIVIRTKPTRAERITTNTMEQALSDDVHCLVTFNSIAAIESLMNGKPAFTMGPNAAHHLSNHDLSDIENPFMPTQDEVYALMKCLAYHQFTVDELRNGYAWSMLTGKS